MKAGQSLAEIAVEIERQAEMKKDFVSPSRALAVTDDAKFLRIGDKGAFEISPNAHKQIGEHLGIHASYYQKMQADMPDLLATNINRWLARNGNEPRMLRTLDERLRAFVSSKFRTMRSKISWAACQWDDWAVPLKTSLTSFLRASSTSLSTSTCSPQWVKR